jgi:murein DD-endopeptidase MepM/ murein hydrolase activator NlpD
VPICGKLWKQTQWIWKMTVEWRNMRGNRKGNIKKERVIMVTSSVLVLAALTMTGVYIKDKSAQVKDDGYSIDFSALENSPEDKYEEIVQQEQPSQVASVVPSQTQNAMEDDLDYAPPVAEVDSGLVEIPGITDGRTSSSASLESEGMANASEAGATAQKAAVVEKPLTEAASLTPEEGEAVAEGTAGESLSAEESLAELTPEAEEVAANSGIVEVAKTLHFPNTILKPSAGSVLIPFSMDGSVYFATLDQYKYSPAVVLSAEEGSPVTAGAEGQVAYVASSGEIGNYIVLDLGDGYQAIYGQLRDIQFESGNYVNAGDVLGFVAAPTKYYSVEGANVFLQLQKDGVPLNPEDYFAE